MSTAPTSPGVPDLAGHLASLINSIKSEVRAVATLSDRTDALVSELNALRAEQARRLRAIDELRTNAVDTGLAAFLDALIRPRRPRVAEVVPQRLQD